MATTKSVVDRIKNLISWLYFYQGLDEEGRGSSQPGMLLMRIDISVTVIKIKVFYYCKYLVSVIMGDNVIKIEVEAFGFR